jgi:hypothetical protein
MKVVVMKIDDISLNIQNMAGVDALLLPVGSLPKVRFIVLFQMV